MPTVHSLLPDLLRGIVGYALGAEIDHVAHEGEAVRAVEAAVRDDDCVAFLGPLLSWQVAETAAVLNGAGIAQLAVAATYAGLTRDEPGAEDGMPSSLSPTGERTLFRVVPRDTAIARAVVTRWPRARLAHDESDYGVQLAAQVRMAGLEEAADAKVTIYAGLAKTAPPLHGKVVSFEGAAEEGIPGVFAMPQRGGEGWSDQDAVIYGPQAKEAAMLVYGSAMAGGPTRGGVLAGLRSCGRFDEFGDTRERRVGLWEYVGARMRPVGTLVDPGD